MIEGQNFGNEFMEERRSLKFWSHQLGHVFASIATIAKCWLKMYGCHYHFQGKSLVLCIPINSKSMITKEFKIEFSILRIILC